MAQINGYKEELQDELQKTDPNSHASRLLAQELERLEKGEDRKDGRSVAMIDVHPQQPQPVALKVRIPIGEFPKFNFVGKLLGPKGNTLKRLQEETGTKMSILGKGSMRDKQKEEELRKEGGKFAHLNDELHVYVEVFAEMTDAYTRLSHAVTELKKFLIPEGNDDIRQQQLQELMYINQGQEPPRGGGRGGGRGGFRGARGGPPPPAAGRGGPPAPARGAPRGAPRGAAPPPPRGAPRGGRGRGGAVPPPPQVPPSYDEYSSAPVYDGYSSRYNEGYDGAGYSDQGYGQGDGQYYDYGSSAGSASYDDYSNYTDYGDSWGTNGSGGGGPVKSARGGVKQRSHPYSGRGGY
ncbi:hypothetical protein BaRGS_00004774 [Batillaria attramentaria]|uniref:K Homology domain-containing protein n=1 Tax=Batillaria attramentaria TaxID=370345 RepID=A0ABD0LYI9_9CAEN